MGDLNMKMSRLALAGILAGELRSIFYLLFLGAAVIAFPSAQGEAGSMRPSNASPATIIVVTNTNDSGPGSLRQALVDANDGDTINFDPSLVAQTITLTSGQLYIRRDVTVTGPGAPFLTVDGNAHIQSGVFYLKQGKAATIS